MRYGDVEVLKGIDLEVASGEILGFLGPNGAGKTTTIEILEGYRQRTAGEVSVLGVDPDHPTRAWRDRIGLVLQECELDPLLTVRETLRLYSAFYRSPRPIDEVISLVGLTGREKARLGALSGGQRRRADVAVALVGDPDLIFLDEPTTGFDPTARREAWNTIEELKQLGKTVLLTTHYMEEAQRLADRVAIIDHGLLVALDTPDALAQHLGGNKLSFQATPGIDIAELERLEGTTSATETKPGQYVIAAEEIDRLVMALMLWANGAGIQPTNIKIERASLEDVFLKLTGEEVRD